MTSYTMFDPEVRDTKSEIIMATHTAPPGTFIIYVQTDRTYEKTPVVLWGVDQNATAVPITLSGVWDGVTNLNMCVLHPTGQCSRYEESWPTLADALDALSSVGD
jgi:hypothetical protein